MPPQLVAHVKKRLAEALSHIYGKGVVHHDIKGDNIMMMSDKRSIRLVGFGMAMAVESNPSNQDEEDEAFRSRCCGMEDFIALEALRFEDTGIAVDVWSTEGFAFPHAGEMLFGHNSARRGTRATRLFVGDRFLKHEPFQAIQAYLVVCMWDFNLKTSISRQEIRKHLWVTQTLAVTTPCKKQRLDLCYLQDLSIWLQSPEAEQQQQQQHDDVTKIKIKIY